MNRLRNVVLPLLMTSLGLASVSCDKAKNAVTAAREKFRGGDPSAPASPGGEVAPDLAAQVDSDAQGARFRRDLPFPVEVDVRSVERVEYLEARIVNTSALGIDTAPLSGKHETIANFRRNGSQLNIQIEKSGRLVENEPVEEKDKKKKVIPVADAVREREDAAKRLQGATIDFRLTNQGWRLPESKGAVDFSRMIWGKELQAALPQVMPSEGVLARTQWFSSTRRWNGGDKFELSGESLALLFPGKTSGSVTLTYEVAEAMEGHPCGRFAVSGDVSVKGRANVEGALGDQEISIRSGKVWCSLLYPLVLREELDTVQTVTTGSGGATVKVQGGVAIVRTRQWKP